MNTIYDLWIFLEQHYTLLFTRIEKMKQQQQYQLTTYESIYYTCIRITQFASYMME